MTLFIEFFRICLQFNKLRNEYVLIEFFCDVSQQLNRVVASIYNLGWYMGTSLYTWDEERVKTKNWKGRPFFGNHVDQFSLFTVKKKNLSTASIMRFYCGIWNQEKLAEFVKKETEVSTIQCTRSHTQNICQ